ncbi:PTS mannitol transporter subunit IICBA [Corynebacterium pacaense]|uniref:PTS mannitol transporter subunit IICBA n=1 Tax=Corynebacterium pacaense TaxID=1816684 RepID=UPI001FEBF211
MIMPNIGAFIAWGLITAFFIPAGWTPNEQIGTLVGPMVTYLLPILIAYSGGRLIYDVRGGVVGAIATMGVILGTSSPVFIGEDGNSSPMFLGAMICGPLFAWLMKKIDGLWDGRIKPGFEMLVDNFSAGIFAGLGAIASMFLLTPVMNLFMRSAGAAVEFLINNNLLFFTSILIEPAKVLFLNNAINHGVLTPLGTEQAVETGKSVLFLLEANPGPGLGILLAYIFFGSGAARATAPGAAIIHFFGGIHEIYFPYVLMKPTLIIAAIGGGMTGVFVNTILGAGLRSPAAPGSILAIYATTASDSYLAVTLGVASAAIVSFLIAAAILKFSKASDEDLAEATAKMESLKGKKSSVSGALTGNDAEKAPLISKIVFACDAGMGSSAMGASVLRNKIKEAGFGKDVTVVNSAINNLRDEFDLLVCHEDLISRAEPPTPSAIHVTVDNFMASPRYDEIVDLVRSQREGGGAAEPAPAGSAPAGASARGGAAQGATATATATRAEAEAEAEEEKKVFTLDSIVLGGTARNRDDAIAEAGQILVDSGAVDASYVDAMRERETSISTYMGNGLAIPHGTNEAKDAIHGSAISFIRYDEPVDWGGNPARFVVGIAGADGSHLGLLAKIAKIFGNKSAVEKLEQAATPEEVLEIFGKVNK